MRALVFALVMVLMPLAAPNVSWGMTDAEAINVSGRQRMLSQRMMKSYLMLGADIKADEAQKQLDQSVALFESQFLALRDYAPDEGINALLDKVESIWLTHRQAILQSPDKKNVDELMRDNLKLLTACNDVVKAIENYSGIASGRLVNISGRQRMLSQKIAKVYMALAWNIDDPGLNDEFDAAVNLFEKSLNELKESDSNTEELAVALTRVSNQWSFSRSGFELSEAGRYVPTVISVTTESILKKMDAITGQYQTVMNKQQMLAAE